MMRHSDVSGLSGVGIVAVGVVWPDGTVSIKWTSIRSSREDHLNMESLVEVHGHAGNTEFLFGNPPCDDDKSKRRRKKKET
jgi:hypothetical protein